ncbi:MAG: CAP domain-containing protein [Oscillospiraceae bacterium]|nr:CAP domain-containing protein [Oscillospiraceae bacterium]
MKKILSLITVFMMLSVFTGCNKTEAPVITNETTSVETVATTEETTVVTTTIVPETVATTEETTTTETTTTVPETTTTEETTTPETTTTVPETTTTVATTATIATTTTVATTTTPPPAPERMTPAEYVAYCDEVARLINEYRVSHGLQECKYSIYITNASQIRANELPTLFAHKRPDGTKYDTALYQVGIADSLRWNGEVQTMWNPGKTKDTYSPSYTVNTQLLGSPNHKEIIDDPRYNYMGVAICVGPDNSHYTNVILVETRRGLTYIP